MHRAAAAPALVVLLCTLAAPGLGAQGEGGQPPNRDARQWSQMAEFGIAAASDRVIDVGLEEFARLAKILEGTDQGLVLAVAAKVLTGPRVRESLPWQIRVYREDPAAGKNAADRNPEPRQVLVQVDLAGDVDLAAALAPFRPEPIAGVTRAFRTGIGDVCVVPRPGGGFRLNAGNVFGADPGSDELLTGCRDIAPRRALDPRFMRHVRGMPVYAATDLAVVQPEQAGRITGLFGSKATTVAMGVTLHGDRPVFNLFSAATPGTGLVGSYADPEPDPAKILGGLSFAPRALFTGDLGQRAPRTLMTLVRGIPDTHPLAPARPVLGELLDAWDGRVSIAATGVELPADIIERGAGLDLLGQMQMVSEAYGKLGKSLRGVLVLGVEAGAGAELARSLCGLLAGPVPQQLGLDLEARGQGEQRAFALPDGHFLSISGGGGLVAVGVDTTAEASVAMSRSALEPRGPVQPPKKLGQVHNPINVWFGREALRYPMLMYEILGRNADQHRKETAFMVGLVRRLFADEVVLTLGWNKQLGFHLRYMF